MRKLLLIIAILAITGCSQMPIAVVNLEYMDGTKEEIHCQHDNGMPNPLAHYRGGVTKICEGSPEYKKVFTHLLRTATVLYYYPDGMIKEGR